MNNINLSAEDSLLLLTLLKMEAIKKFYSKPGLERLNEAVNNFETQVHTEVCLHDIPDPKQFIAKHFSRL